MSPRAFSEAYQSAIYKAAGMAFTLSEKPTGTVLFEGRKFAIITAHNPRSERLSSEENRQRHEELGRDLKVLGLEYTPSTGESPDGTWVEEGFAVFDVSLEQALELGRKYGQHAIIYGEGERVALAWCESENLEVFSPKKVNPQRTVEYNVSVSNVTAILRQVLNAQTAFFDAGEVVSISEDFANLNIGEEISYIATNPVPNQSTDDVFDLVACRLSATTTRLIFTSSTKSINAVRQNLQALIDGGSVEVIV